MVQRFFEALLPPAGLPVFLARTGAFPAAVLPGNATGLKTALFAAFEVDPVEAFTGLLEDGFGPALTAFLTEAFAAGTLFSPALKSTSSRAGSRPG